MMNWGQEWRNVQNCFSHLPGNIIASCPSNVQDHHLLFIKCVFEWNAIPTSLNTACPFFARQIMHLNDRWHDVCGGGRGAHSQEIPSSSLQAAGIHPWRRGSKFKTLALFLRTAHSGISQIRKSQWKGLYFSAKTYHYPNSALVTVTFWREAP